MYSCFYFQLIQFQRTKKEVVTRKLMMLIEVLFNWKELRFPSLTSFPSISSIIFRPLSEIYSLKIKYTSKNGGCGLRIVLTSSKLADWRFLLQMSLFTKPALQQNCFSIYWLQKMQRLALQRSAKMPEGCSSAVHLSWPKSINQVNWEQSFVSYFWLWRRS